MDINKFPLFDPNKFHDACGIGFITTESAKPEKRVFSTALSSLKNYLTVAQSRMIVKPEMVLVF